MVSLPKLQQKIINLALEKLAGFLGAYLPGGRIPAVFAGRRVTSSELIGETAFALTRLRLQGVKLVAGIPLDELLLRLLRQADPAMSTFYSFMTAEAVLATGTWAESPLIAQLTSEERERLARAVDTTSIYDFANNRLFTHPNNFYPVLARAEHARWRLGLLPDDSQFRHFLSLARDFLFKNPLGYTDDARQGSGRYDIYSMDVNLFMAPLWDELDREKLLHNLRQQVRLLEHTAMPNGACVAWGRSHGVLSLCMTAQFAAVGLRFGLSENPARLVGLLQNAVDRLATDWYDDALPTYLHERRAEWYRQDIAKMALLLPGKLLFAAEQLGIAASAVSSAPLPAPNAERAAELFPPQDAWLDFDGRGAGAWFYRDGHLAFQLPVVFGRGADYLAWFHSPGLLDSPTDSETAVGVPRVFLHGKDLVPKGPAADREKMPAGLRLRHDTFHPLRNEDADAPWRAVREVAYRVADGGIEATEHWSFPELPEAITFAIPSHGESIVAAWETDADALHRRTRVRGIDVWRSAYGAFTTLDEWEFAPARSIAFRYRLQPAS
jgi:hypothetical protein